jgi:GABA permease
MVQPYATALEAIHVPIAAQIMNCVVLTAVLSALNSGLFASSRMMMALARRGDAPRAASQLNRRGVPVLAILLSTTFGYVAVIMNYISPGRVFAFLVDSYGTVALFVYLLIAVAQLRLRRRLELEAPERLRVRMWAFPTLTLTAIATMIAIIAAMAFIPGQRLPLLFGVLSALSILVAFAVRRRFGDPAPESATS